MKEWRVQVYVFYALTTRNADPNVMSNSMSYSGSLNIAFPVLCQKGINCKDGLSCGSRDGADSVGKLEGEGFGVVFLPGSKW